MKKMKITALAMSFMIVISGCGSMNNTGKGAAIGAGSGAAVGAAIGAIFGKGKGAAIGAAIGTAVGTTTGTIIGKKMDDKAAKAAQIEGAQVEKVQDANGLTAVKVSFSSGILFGFNSAKLSEKSKVALKEFAELLKEDKTIDIAVFGHTDKVGSLEANKKVSLNRALAVQNFLQQCGVSTAQFKEVKGMGYEQYDDSKSADKNRRVEVYMYASAKMIEEANAGK